MRFSSETDMSKVIARTITAEVKGWAAQQFIPQENFRDVEILRECNRLGFTAMLTAHFAGIKDQRTVRDEVLDTIPSSLMDWVRFHINRILPKWMEPLKVKTVDLIRHHEETWRICPHVLTKMEDRQHMHLRWMEYGGEFDFIARPEQRIAAERILTATLNLANSRNQFVPGELMHAVHIYKQAAGIQ